ncbi:MULTISPECIES: hypothetical protein [unclassified Vibrio]|uniref:hypothetical protein n=2 Tax=Vibrio TaxID=662 RepID=UPI001361C3D4|nr:MULTISPECIES: hypothetical protein [unclassified Vibrio]NAW59347.1 hypothetical protein [Vibrio sp. V36_P2S2PM302]NAX26788.1 hypothetical protein [Vibrio sp. V38_P2S17PM301]
MYTQIEKSKGNESRIAANSVAQKKNVKKSFSQSTDRRVVDTRKTFGEKPHNYFKSKNIVQLRYGARTNMRGVSASVAQREMIAGTDVVVEGGYPAFEMNNKKYHINYSDVKHITCDTEGRTHYYFKGEGQDIQDAVGPGKKKQGKKQVKYKFSDLPINVQNFIKENYYTILRVQEEGQINV